MYSDMKSKWDEIGFGVMDDPRTSAYASGGYLVITKQMEELERMVADLGTVAQRAS